MFEEVITPRFSETDALGHIGNTVVPIWFEAARGDVFRLVHPSLTLNDWPMILASIDVQFEAQIYFGADVTIKTGVKKVGNSSLTLHQQVWQNDKRVASGNTVQVFFDFKTNKSTPIPDDTRTKLVEHLMGGDQ